MTVIVVNDGGQRVCFRCLINYGVVTLPWHGTAAVVITYGSQCKQMLSLLLSLGLGPVCLDSFPSELEGKEFPGMDIGFELPPTLQP